MTRLRIGLVGLACAGTAAATGCGNDQNLPESCEDVQRDFLDDNNDFPEDGEYTVYFDGDKSRPLTVWCENMNRDQPKDYLSVRASENYSEFSNGSATVVTEFDRLRIDPIRLEIDPWDFTFATTRGDTGLLDDNPPAPSDDDFMDMIGTATAPQHVPYGIAYRKTTAVRSIDAAAHIELVGTGLVLAEETADDGYFCLYNDDAAAAVDANMASSYELSDDLSEATLIANDVGIAVSFVAPGECDDFSPGTRIPLQYDGLD